MQNLLTVTCNMEHCSLQLCSSSTLTNLPYSMNRRKMGKRLCLFSQIDKLSNSKKCPGCRKLKCADIRAQLSSGIARFSSLQVEATQKNADSKDEDTVFVAGATGKVGSRTVRELLKLGVKVRAGVRSAQRAESLIQSVREMKLDTEITSGLKPTEKLEIVECDLEKPDQIVPAIGTASVVVCCIGASEKEIFDVTGPYRIDYQATKNLIDAACVAKVNHFILLTSLGTNKIGFPAAILNLFWGVLIWKRKAELALIASGLPYTIVRPGGMERPTDSYKETHNITLSEEDTLFGGQVSNLQVAELLAFMAQNRKLSYCKIVEVVAETTAPLTPMGDLLVKIPSTREEPYKAEELDAVTKLLDPEPAKSSIATDVAGEETVQDSSLVAKPLSPYTAYSDLKPPSSPTPTAPTGPEKKTASADTEPSTSYTATGVFGSDTDTSEATTVKLQKICLSPYAAYEDLKPPSSPSPSPPQISRHEPLETSKDVDGLPMVTNGTLAENDPRQLTFYHSPFPVYDDLRPPTSPTPAAPNSSAQNMTLADSNSQMASNSTVDEIETVTAQNTMDEQNCIVPKPKPLSPYTMYDDMKPPSSPMPSPGNR